MGYRFDVLYQNDHLVVIDKPEGFHVHRPESRAVRADPAIVVLQQLRDQLGVRVYPVHRLDVPTSGCLLFALNSQTAGALSKQFETKDFQKTYTGVVRGWVNEAFDIDIPLECEDKSKLLDALSRVSPCEVLELSEPVGIRHASARYSLVKLEPVTGRFHQLRRHLNRVSKPLVGDVMHGDRHHNHFFAQKLGIEGLCLRANALKFINPADSQIIEIIAPWPDKWHKIFKLFKVTS